MKRTLALVIATGWLVGCTDQIDPAKLMERSMNPFVEYHVPDRETADELERGILAREADKNGLDTAKTSAHMISLKKIGTYGTGEVMIMGELTSTELTKLKNRGVETNGILSYKCEYEYDFKRGTFTWRSGYPFAQPD